MSKEESINNYKIDEEKRIDMKTYEEVKREKEYKKAEFARRYLKYHLVYIALIGTAVLSVVTGLLLPYSSENANNVGVAGMLAALYFAVGFVTNGELAANYWFGKLTDHDPDSTAQKTIAVIALAISVITSLITALAASLLIAYWLKIFSEFSGIPSWAQVYIVDIIPVMWVFHAVMGMAFKAFSEEAEMERTTKAFIRQKQNELVQHKEEAKANWWKENAEKVYREQGEIEAREALNRQFPNRKQMVTNGAETERPAHPTNPPKQNQ